MTPSADGGTWRSSGGAGREGRRPDAVHAAAERTELGRERGDRAPAVGRLLRHRGGAPPTERVVGIGCEPGTLLLGVRAEAVQIRRRIVGRRLAGERARHEEGHRGVAPCELAEDHCVCPAVRTDDRVDVLDLDELTGLADQPAEDARLGASLDDLDRPPGDGRTAHAARRALAGQMSAVLQQAEARRRPATSRAPRR